MFVKTTLKFLFLAFIVFWALCPLDAYIHAVELPATGSPSVEPEAEIPLLVERDVLNFPITTKSSLSQRYFIQGLVLAYGFDHEDAEKSFLEAARLDPECAMCYWGASLVLGPNINAPMDDAAVPRAYGFVQKAIMLSQGATPKEKMLIQALSKRYAPEPVKDRAGLDGAFAEAMKGVATEYPADPDVGVLYAEALMDLHPWDYWAVDGKPKPWTPQIRSILESIIEANPRHPHARHLYIHLLENSPFPEKTVKSADILVDLVPLSGHLVHMAGHAYLASGLYHDCSIANEKAIKVDQLLTSSFPSEGLYHLFYVPHVEQFLWFCYTMEGRSADAGVIARELAKHVGDSMMRKPGLGTLQHYWVIKYYSLVRFGKWAEILAEAEPAENLKYAKGVWHYMRGMAFARTGRYHEAEKELEMVRKIAAEPALKKITVWDLNAVPDLLAIAAEVLAGELAFERGMFERATGHFEKGVSLEESLVFDEPPPWYYPVRQSLGAVLLETGKAKESEEVFRRDLQKNPENGWSLFGLAQSLRAQGKDDPAKDVENRFRKAWARSDVELRSSRF